jgi:hypothetical protein
MRYVIVVAVVLVALLGVPTVASAQSSGCRWVGNGTTLFCEDTAGTGATLSTWQGLGWTTVPAAAGGALPALAGGLSAYGSSYPPSPVTPAAGYAAASQLGNSLTQTTVMYGPGARSQALTCNTAYANSAWYSTCR